MIRTQIYLTEQEQTALKALTQQTGKSQSELIRDAVDRLLAQFDSRSRLDKLRVARGMWKNRDDLADFEATRQSLNRS
ncbi:MAG: ribbon-helix-helix protein, CopG family [Sulfurimicrobium sp.]|nr:ribbon-helix-helix protein, CopG family [Sulfurimicrobium sp.]